VEAIHSFDALQERIWLLATDEIALIRGEGKAFLDEFPQLLGHDIAQTPIKLRWGGLLDTDGLLIAKIA